jgi:hypothetical protein
MGRSPTPATPSRLPASLPAAPLPSTCDSDDGVRLSNPAPTSNGGETKSPAADSDNDKPRTELSAAGGSGGSAPAPARDDSDSDSDDVPLSVVMTELKLKVVVPVDAKHKLDALVRQWDRQDAVLKNKAAPHGLRPGDRVRALHDSNHIASRRAGDVGTSSPAAASPKVAVDPNALLL